MVQTTQKPAAKGTDAHLEKFSRFESQARQPAWLFPLRKAGIARFAELGFPTLQQEDWRFTNVARIAKLPFRPMLEPAAEGISPDALEQFPFARLPGSRLVFVNGHYTPRLSSRGGPPEGARGMNVAAAP